MTTKSFFRKNNQTGFSIIEIVIYVAVLTLMLSIIIGTVYSLGKSGRVIRTARAIENSAVTVLERVEREIHEADSIVSGSSVFGTHPGRLILSSAQSGASVETEFYLSEGALRMKKGGADQGALTDSAVAVTSLVFRHFTASETEGVRIELELTAGEGADYRVEKFYSSLLLR